MTLCENCNFAKVYIYCKQNIQLKICNFVKFVISQHNVVIIRQKLWFHNKHYILISSQFCSLNSRFQIKKLQFCKIWEFMTKICFLTQKLWYCNFAKFVIFTAKRCNFPTKKKYCSDIGIKGRVLVLLSISTHFNATQAFTWRET